ncbi:Uncharacterized protein AXF42_Ash003418 [Apostasia shenzhenica]|uniref:BZIP domain-containing protein n=1 Tax=Apostasia shenzhenica TaxID=1088818 RepID=A0A2I0BG28_9ASPA|nr:Uncharacterized protein AXF42_Ash003418 [Apostasia shenzhenica]
MKGASCSRNPVKQSFLPPKSPFPSAGAPKLTDVPGQHQRTSSESFLIEEQPSWLDELLNEPETPVQRGHRRSSSDSFAFLDVAYAYSNADILAQEECGQRTITSMPSWGALEFDHVIDTQHYCSDRSSFDRPQNRVWEAAFNKGKCPVSVPAAKKEPEASSSSSADKLEQGESPTDAKNSLEKKEASQTKNSQMETDTKRIKQQFAQRSRVRKLQYIAELERSVQALQASIILSSERLNATFLNQQNLILNLENKALTQRLDSLAQEQLIKRLQQEMLEREIARLRILFQQHSQPPMHALPSHGRSSSRDLDSQFANLTLKQKESYSGSTGLHI